MQDHDEQQWEHFGTVTVPTIVCRKCGCNYFYDGWHPYFGGVYTQGQVVLTRMCRRCGHAEYTIRAMTAGELQELLDKKVAAMLKGK